MESLYWKILELKYDDKYSHKGITIGQRPAVKEDGELTLLILSDQAAIVVSSSSSSSYRFLVCHRVKAKPINFNLMKEVKIDTSSPSVLWAKIVHMSSYCGSTKVWQLTALHEYVCLIILLSPWASQFTARVFIYCQAHAFFLVFSKQFHQCFMLFSPFTCNSFDICLKYTSNPSIILNLLQNLTRSSPGVVSSEAQWPIYVCDRCLGCAKVCRFPTLGKSKGLCSFSPVQG